jgi:hypothetical protein
MSGANTETPQAQRSEQYHTQENLDIPQEIAPGERKAVGVDKKDPRHFVYANSHSALTFVLQPLEFSQKLVR